MALVNDCEAGSVRAPPERGGLALGAALSLALHVGGLVAALSVSLRAEEPEELVIEVVWETPAPVEATSSEVAAAEPEPTPPSSAPIEPEPEPLEPQPPRQANPQPPEPEPPPQAEPEPPPPPVVVAEAPAAEPPPRPAVKPKRRVEAPAPAAQADRPVQAAPPPPASASPASDAVAAAPAAPPAPAASQQDDYVRTLLRWLEPHRRYPRAARVRGLEGLVRVSLLIDRAGSVLESRVAESSGEPLLDAAALEMVARAAPAPPLPAHWGAQRAVFLVPIRFALSG